MNFILEHLAIGDAQEAQTHGHVFGALLNVAAEVLYAPADTRQSFLHVPLADMQRIHASHLQQAVQFIDREIATRRLLVFCDGGVGRSPSVVVAYLCFKGMRFGQAVEFVAVRKPYMSILPELYDSIRLAFRRSPAPVLPVERFALPSEPVNAVIDIRFP